MVDTIGPMVRGAEHRRHQVEAAHLAGGALGGAATGFVLGALGAIAGFDDGLVSPLLGVLSVVAAAALGYDLVHEGRKFGLARQTSQAWRHVLPSSLASFLNGFDLGLGWSTRIYFSSYGVAMVAAVLTAHAFVGAAIGAAFGLGRAAFVVVAQRRSRGALSIDVLADSRPRVSALNGVALIQFGMAAALAALSGA